MYFKKLNKILYKQTMYTLIRRRILWCLIWVYIVCLSLVNDRDITTLISKWWLQNWSYWVNDSLMIKGHTIRLSIARWYKTDIATQIIRTISTLIWKGACHIHTIGLLPHIYYRVIVTLMSKGHCHIYIIRRLPHIFQRVLVTLISCGGNQTNIEVLLQHWHYRVIATLISKGYCHTRITGWLIHCHQRVVVTLVLFGDFYTDIKGLLPHWY